MLVIHGTYHLFPKRVAFRNDFCLKCGAQRRAFQIRTFDILHVFWVPLLPIGFWKRWRCTSCGADPHANVKTRRSYKIAGVAILLLMTLGFWFAPIEKGDEVLFWALRIGAPLLAVWAIWNIRTTPVEPTLTQQLAAVAPAQDATCPLCGFALANTPTWHCPRCGLRRA